jgi:hypothetical protein
MKKNTDDLRTPFPGAGRPTPNGTPTWQVVDMPMPCPNCGCQMVEVSCPVTPPAMLRTTSGAVARYLGCPACPFASAAVVTAK